MLRLKYSNGKIAAHHDKVVIPRKTVVFIAVMFDSSPRTAISVFSFSKGTVRGFYKVPESMSNISQSPVLSNPETSKITAMLKPELFKQIKLFSISFTFRSLDFIRTHIQLDLYLSENFS
jgi:hypothetical protein